MIVCTPPYPNKFSAGDIAISKINVDFPDQTSHMIGQQILVKEETEAYFNVHHDYYDKK
jgi:hypothetical protein